MSIRFTPDDWKRIRETYAAWWKGELDRPLVQCQVSGAFDPGREKPCVPLLSQQTCTDFSYSPEELIDAIDWDLSHREFLGDSFPLVNMHTFGPGVAAAFAGAKLDNSAGSVWFFPEKELPIEEISIRYDPRNKWVRRIKDIYRAGGERWRGNVLMTMPDLGGIMDIVATFVGSENLLFALIDSPDEVKRLVREAHTLFFDAYNDLNEVLRSIGNPGFSDWNCLYSESPSYILQSDFSYMIGPDMFREFVLDDIAASCRRLSNAVYHLDGVGQLNHLPHLLSIPELKSVQWVPGDGKPRGRVWLDVYRQIIESGRTCEIVGERQDFLDLLTDFPRGLFYKTGFADRDSALRFLKAAGCPER